MRSLYFLAAALLASPLVSGRSIRVDVKKLAALESAFSAFENSVKSDQAVIVDTVPYGNGADHYNDNEDFSCTVSSSSIHEALSEVSS